MHAADEDEHAHDLGEQSGGQLRAGDEPIGQITDIATGVAYVRHGLGIALLPRFILGAARDVSTLPVTGADLRWPLSLATPTDRPPGAPARALITLIRHVLAAG